MRREALYLDDIVEAGEAIARFLEGVDRAAFLTSELIQSAVLQKLTVMGEAVANLPDSLKQKYPHVPWREIVKFRNAAVHAYFGMNWPLIWITATQHAPLLKRDVTAIIAAEGYDADE